MQDRLTLTIVAAEPSQDQVLGVTVNGQQRIAYLHVPPILPGKKYPLVIGYHGGAGNAEGYILDRANSERLLWVESGLNGNAS